VSKRSKTKKDQVRAILKGKKNWFNFPLVSQKPIQTEN
jgi:hypothetical protein